MKGGAASDQAGCRTDGDEIEASWDRVQAETGSIARIEMQGKLGRFSIKIKKNKCGISHFWSGKVWNLYKEKFQTWTDKCFGQRKKYFPLQTHKIWII